MVRSVAARGAEPPECGPVRRKTAWRWRIRATSRNSEIAGGAFTAAVASPRRDGLAADALRDRAVEHAGARSTAELVGQFTPAAIAELRQQDPGRRVDCGGLAVIAAGEALRIFLLEAVVHYFDMAHALDRPVPWPMAGAPVGETARLLVGMADPVALIDAATGRGQTRIFPLLR